mmetsp:Transcript_38701/g.116937  ORF Transcript_38701/g.116937 Transcript_38701/m.116937 type:complete len:301 (+) Transcript_38701:447-1349(+)
MLVGGVAHHLLHVIHSLLEGGMGLALGREALEVLVVGLLESFDLTGVLVGRLPDHALQEGDALPHRGVMLVGGPQRIHPLGVLVVGRGKLAVRGPERLDLAPMLVRRVADHLLQILHPLRHGRVVGRGHPKVLQALDVLVMGIFQSLQVPGVLVRRIAKQPLNIVEPLADCGVVVRVLPEFLHPFRMLVVGIFQNPQLLRVLVGGVPEQLLEVVDALRQGRVVHVGLLQLLDGASMLVVRIHERLHLAGVRLVLGRRVADRLLQELDAVGDLRTRLVDLPVRHAQGLLDVGLVGLQRGHL